MKFDELEIILRQFETAQDRAIDPSVYFVARLDGRSFTRLTKETLTLEAPFDIRFRDHMIAVSSHLMSCGFNVTYAFTQSDEVSLLFQPDESAFGRSYRKYLSVLAGEASARMSLLVRTVAVFDCRIAELPLRENVVDYFRWRSEDAGRNCLNAHCYWVLRGSGESIPNAALILTGISASAKKDLLHQHGINYSELPAWQRRGIGIYWTREDKKGLDPRTSAPTLTTRRRLKVDVELPVKGAYDALIHDLSAVPESDVAK